MTFWGRKIILTFTSVVVSQSALSGRRAKANPWCETMNNMDTEEKVEEESTSGDITMLQYYLFVDVETFFANVLNVGCGRS